MIAKIVLSACNFVMASGAFIGIWEHTVNPRLALSILVVNGLSAIVLFMGFLDE